MDTVTPLPERKAIEAEACAWIAQLDGTEPSQQDLAALREWMNRSPAHRHAIEQLSALWDDLNIFTELAVPRPHPERGRRKSFFSNRFRRMARPIPATVATCVLLLAFGVVTWQWRDTGSASPILANDAEAPPSAVVQAGIYATAIGEQESIELTDGSRITLNTDSQVQVAFNEDNRDIRLLKGEALFEVANDPDRPFRVYAGNGMVRAIGTSFTVHLKDPDNVSVTVSEGEVELATVSVPDVELRSGDTAELPAAPLARIKAGQIATFGLDIESILTLEQAELSRRLSWRDGMLRFDGEPLSEAVREVSRYTTQEIIILDPALRDLRIGGYFKAGETDAMFDALESSFGVRVERINESLVHLSARR
jgi:transmembrane sensor